MWRETPTGSTLTQHDTHMVVGYEGDLYYAQAASENFLLVRRHLRNRSEAQVVALTLASLVERLEKGDYCHRQV